MPPMDIRFFLNMKKLPQKIIFWNMPNIRPKDGTIRPFFIYLSFFRHEKCINYVIYVIKVTLNLVKASS